MHVDISYSNHHKCNNLWQMQQETVYSGRTTILLTTASSALLHSQSGLTSFSSWPRMRTSSMTIFTNFFKFSWIFIGSGKLPTCQQLLQYTALGMECTSYLQCAACSLR